MGYLVRNDRYSPQLEANFRTRKRNVADSWRMDETYIKIKGKWVYYYRAVDKHGVIVDFYLSETRDEPAARAFFDKALDSDTLNAQLWLSGYILCMIEVLTVKYLNNIVEQSHRKVKGKMHQCLGWKSWVGAEATLAGVELCSMLKQEPMIDSEARTDD